MGTYYPPTGFHFKVEFQGISPSNADIEQRFQDVGGLSFEIETEALNEGGENRFTHQLPKRAQYPNLILKRGLLTNSFLKEWLDKAMNTYFTVAVYDFKPVDILISLFNENGEPVAIWNVIQAYPLKWNISNFKSMENALVIESIEFAYQYFQRKM